MGHYTELPVYKAAYDVVLHIFVVVKNFNKEYKYTLGENIKMQASDLILHIFNAVRRTDKNTDLDQSRECIERIRLYFRLAKDLKQVNLKKFIFINDRLENVSKQITGWQRSLKQTG